jgi:two-component system, chemotaxis family, protein-glutamate methylesterase/glutaminase
MMNQRERGPLKVLVVDDSAVVRQVAAAILSQENINVTVAADPLIAMDKMARERPDVIMLDLEMPRMHGITFLRKIMVEDPIPVVVCSGFAESGGAIAISALEEGAVAVIAKPKLGVRDFLHESAVTLIDTIVSASEAKLRSRRKIERIVAPIRQKAPAVSHSADSRRVVAIGASTGGPEAIAGILAGMDLDCPPIVIVQHMPEGFTAAYANRLNGTCRIRVKEGEPGDQLTPGLAIIAPGNRHMAIRPAGTRYIVQITDDVLINRHRPSVDVLFRSVAKAAGANALGILLTGMGQDGAAGLLAMRQAGAATIAQDESSSVVFGMPKEAIALGGAESVLGLAHVPAAIRKWSFKRPAYIDANNAWS